MSGKSKIWVEEPADVATEISDIFEEQHERQEQLRNLDALGADLIVDALMIELLESYGLDVAEVLRQAWQQQCVNLRVEHAGRDNRLSIITSGGRATASVGLGEAHWNGEHLWLTGEGPATGHAALVGKSLGDLVPHPVLSRRPIVAVLDRHIDHFVFDLSDKLMFDAETGRTWRPEARGMTGVVGKASAHPEFGIDPQADLFNVGIAWGSALFQIIALNPRPPDGVIIAWGRLGGEGGDTVADVGGHAEQTGRDVIYLGFGGEISDGPTNVVVAKVGRRGVTLHQNCEVWYFSRRRRRVELLVADRRFKLDEASHLKGRRTPSTRCEPVASRAQARWRQLATKILEESASDGATGRSSTTT